MKISVTAEPSSTTTQFSGRSARRSPLRAAHHPTRSISRRGFLGVGASLLALPLVGCADDEPSDPAIDLQTPAVAGTPAGVVPGYDAPDRWAGRSLRVGAWGGEIQLALKELVWQPFARATGCTIEEVTTEYTRLDADSGTTSYADALVVGSDWAWFALERGLVQALSGAAGQRRTDLIDRGDHHLPAYAYAMVATYRRDALETFETEPPQTWREWWDRSRYPGDRTLGKGPLGTFEFALMADGVPPESLYPLDGARAIDNLRRISGAIVDRWWETGDQSVAWVARDRADFGTAWHYRVASAQRDGLPVELVWNQGLLVADHWVVPAGAANADVAMDFLGYATAPEVQAALARATSLGPVIGSAFDHLDPLIAITTPTQADNLPQLVRQNEAWWAESASAVNSQFNSWLLGVPNG